MPIVCFAGLPLSFAQAQEIDPLPAFAGYFSALKSGERDQLLPYLNGKSLGMMKNRPYSASMMAMEAQTIENCGLPQIKMKKTRAVVFFTPLKTNCTPYFMQFQADAWRMDLYTMSQVIRFDTSNNWHMDTSLEHPYHFAFSKKE